MKDSRVPIYKEYGRTYHADSCDPLSTASRKGQIELKALSRGTYPGARLPAGDLEGLRSAGYWNAKREQDWGLEWHRNEGIELTLLETGSIDFALEGSSYKLQPGNLTITRPWQPHKVGLPNVGVGKLHWIIIDVGMRHPHQDWKWPKWLIISSNDIAELTQFLRQNEQPVWKSSAEIQNCFRQIAGTIASYQKKTGTSRLAVYINELLLLVLELFRTQRITLSKSLTSARRSTELFLSALAANVSEQWTLESMAETCGLGVTRFVHYCRELTNCTPVEFLNRIRIEKAAALLRTKKELNITEIAFECGFSTSQYFATVFRKHHKCTPAEYRKRS
jgi:AraC family L-rhamnose operon regulatory protein RhaS